MHTPAGGPAPNAVMHTSAARTTSRWAMHIGGITDRSAPTGAVGPRPGGPAPNALMHIGGIADDKSVGDAHAGRADDKSRAMHIGGITDCFVPTGAVGPRPG